MSMHLKADSVTTLCGINVTVLDYNLAGVVELPEDATCEWCIAKSQTRTDIENAVLAILTNEEIDNLEMLSQAREQEIFTELVAKKAYHRCDGGWFEYVPFEVIERLQNKTNDGGQT